MTIHIEALTLNVIIGLLEFERKQKQRLIVDVTVDYAYADGVFIDYAVMVEQIEATLHTHRYLLLEEALLGIKNLLITTYPHIKKLQLKLTKPDILSECRVALSHQWIF